MRRAVPAIVLALLPLSPSACAAQVGATEADGVAAWRSGRYDQAEASLAAAARVPGASWTVRRAHVHMLLEVARFDAAADAASGYAAEIPADSALMGDVAESQGQLDVALSAYDAALRAGTPDSVRVLARKGAVLARLGRWTEAHAVDALAAEAGQGSRDARALIALSAARVRGGRINPQEFRTALALLDQALALEPGHPGVNAALSDLFLSKYNAPDARAAALAALEANPRHPGALLAEARRRRFESQSGVDSLTRLALEVAPASVRARAFAGVLRLDAEDREGAMEHAEAALRTDPSDPEALAVLAAAHLMAGDDRAVTGVEERARQAGPAAGRFYALLGEQAARLRRYQRAAEFGTEGARLDPLEFRAHAVAGINLLRVGDIEGSRTALEQAFAGDPFDVWTKNTLDLLDSYDLFEERREGRVTVFLEREEADLIAPYIRSLVEAAIDSLSLRYRYVPDDGIRIELYRRPADFSVRTVGLAGMGALGVSFGDVLAMISPVGRSSGAYNFGSTAWHEVAHTYTLGLSEGKVPRWLSEGISVYEERRARRGWGARPDPAMLAAFASGDLPPPSRLGEAFASPGTAVRLGQAYVLASLVAAYVADVHGEQALPEYVRAFAGGATQEEALRASLDLSPDELDTRFRSWMRQRYPAFFGDDPAATVRRIATDVRQGAELLAAGREREALEPLQRALDMVPDYGGDDSPRALLGRAQLALGDTASALTLLGQHTALAESDLASNLLVADVHEARGDTASALEALDRAVWLAPYEPALHERLAVSARVAGRHDLVVRERRAVVALNPADRAGAHFELAVALRDAGDPVAARSEVLRALDLAPNFARAQDLLLELRTSIPEGRP